MRTDPPTLADPPFYFPLRHGRYDVAPGLARFGKDLGGGTDADGRVFQFDITFPQFRAAKLASHQEHPDCIVSDELPARVARSVAGFMATRLAAEHPRHFSLEAGDSRLRCRLTGDCIALDAERNAEDSLVEIGLQIQEDFAILCTPQGDTGGGGGGAERLRFAHVCLPNGWAPGEKVGGSFAQIHEPVAGMAAMNLRGREFADLMTRATSGLVRFAWGITFDDALDHHPAQRRVPFDPASPRVFLRVERQTIWGFPDVGAALFTIRTYLYDTAPLRRDPVTRQAIAAALRTMPADSVRYKGLSAALEPLLTWINGGDDDGGGGGGGGSGLPFDPGSG